MVHLIYITSHLLCVRASVHTHIPHTHTNTHMCMHSHSTYIHVLTYIPTTYIQKQSINAIIDTHIYTHTYTYIYLALCAVTQSCPAFSDPGQ